MNTGLSQTNDLASLKKQASDLMTYLKRNTYYIRGANQNLKDLQHKLKEAYKDYANREQQGQQWPTVDSAPWARQQSPPRV